MTGLLTSKNSRYTFGSTKELLAKANEEKSGDVLAGIAAGSDQERVEAKLALSKVTLEQLKEEPVVPACEDEVTRFIDDNLDPEAYDQIKSWTVEELREFILSSPVDGDQVSSIKLGLTGEMVAAVTKIMSNLDLIAGAKRCRVSARANTTLGIKGVLGARLQPNHPTDSLEGIISSIYEGLSYGVGRRCYRYQSCL